MESSGECRGCQRNIKFAVKQARLCRTCYNKTYLTSQKRREYYKNKKKRRETSSSVEPAIDVHQHRHHSKSIKKEDSQGNRSPPRTLPDNSGQDPVAAHLYLLSYQSHTQLRSCSDCVPQAGLFASAAPSSASPAALSLAALAHASQHHASSSPASPLAGSANGSLLHHLSSATTTSSSPCSPASSPPLSVASRPQQVHVQYHVATHQSMSPESASSSALVTPYGSPPTPGPVLFQDLLQQMSYYAAMAPMLGLAPVGMPTEMFATTSTTSSSSFSSSSSSAACGLPSLSAFFLPTSSTNPLAIPTPRYPPSTPQPPCQQCHSPAAPAQRVDTTTPEPTWLCETCLADRRRGAQPATRSPAIKNLLN